MFNSMTTIVVGAGASAELGMPVGSKLKKTIATKLDIRFSDGSRQSSGDTGLTEAYRLRVRSKGQRDINPYREARVSLSEALPLAISIDNFLEAHAAEEKRCSAENWGSSNAFLTELMIRTFKPRLEAATREIERSSQR